MQRNWLQGTDKGETATSAALAWTSTNVCDHYALIRQLRVYQKVKQAEIRAPELACKHRSLQELEKERQYCHSHKNLSEI